MSDIELSPCPWCSGAGEMYHHEADGGGPHCIQCSVCRAYPGRFYETEAEAIAAWNRRASDPLAARNEALEEAAVICDRVAASLSDYSERYRREGRDNDMYRANTAWHNVTGIAETIRALLAKVKEP